MEEVEEVDVVEALLPGEHKAVVRDLVAVGGRCRQEVSSPFMHEWFQRCML